MRINLVPMGQLSTVLAEVLPYLKVSEEWTRGRANVDDILRMVLNGQMHLWCVHDDVGVHGQLITEIKQYPQCKLLTIQYCAMEPGIMDAIEEQMQDIAQRFAKDAGCSGIEFVGRPGWRRVAGKYGYDVQSVVYQKFFKET